MNVLLLGSGGREHALAWKLTKSPRVGWVLVAPGKFEIKQVPIPICGPSDVLVKVKRAGICGTDIHIYKGHFAAESIPLIPGHEFSGVVAAVGSEASSVKVGTPVVADINVGCGQEITISALAHAEHEYIKHDILSLYVLHNCAIYNHSALFILSALSILLSFSISIFQYLYSLCLL